MMIHQNSLQYGLSFQHPSKVLNDFYFFHYLASLTIKVMFEEDFFCNDSGGEEVPTIFAPLIPESEHMLGTMYTELEVRSFSTLAQVGCCNKLQGNCN